MALFRSGEVGVSIAWQQRLETRRMGQSVSGLPVLNGLRQRATIGSGDQVAVDERVVNLHARLLLTVDDVVGLRANLLPRELERGAFCRTPTSESGQAS